MKSATLQFDPLLRANHKRVATGIAEFIELLLSAEQTLKLRERTRRPADYDNFAKAAEALVCNLLLSSQADKAVLAVPRSHKMMWGKSRYRNAIYGEHFVGLLDLMAELGFVSELTRGYRVNNIQRQPTTIRPTKKFLRRVSIPSARANWIRQAEEPEVLVLKSSKDAEGVSSQIEYEETPATTKLRKEVCEINAFLATANVSLSTQAGKLLVDRDQNVIGSHQRSLRRIFNNGSWNDGGRLFGGFWMNMERGQRFRSIRIGGEKVANVDFSALFPRLAYTRVKARPPRGDLYEYSEVSGQRDGWKKLTNALLFATKPLRGWPHDTKHLFSEEVTLSEAVAAIKKKHAAIADLFEHGAGFHFMRIESDMLIQTVSRLRAENIVALPLHDSVLVAKKFAARARELMEEQFKRHTGSSLVVVTIDTGGRESLTPKP